MTFSITGHCARTGMFGVAITTSSICVGSRCPHARAGVGAVATQNVTDPTLAARVFERLEAGDSAAEAVAAVMDGRVHADYRQLAVVDELRLLMLNHMVEVWCPLSLKPQHPLLHVSVFLRRVYWNEFHSVVLVEKLLKR